MSLPLSASSPTRSAVFHTTRWSMVLDARQTEAGVSLESLCRQYWPPLYAWLRQHGYTVHEAQDLTQEFFARLLAKDWLHAVDQSRGRFRTFLLMALKRFLANERDRRGSLKRGGGLEFIPVNPDIAEHMAVPDPTTVPPEVAFDRRWALTLLESVMARLRLEQEEAGRAAEYEILKPGLTAQGLDYSEMGRRLEITPASARSAMHRLRRRFRELFRSEVAATVADASEVDAEMQAVIAALGAV